MNVCFVCDSVCVFMCMCVLVLHVFWGIGPGLPFLVFSFKVFLKVFLRLMLVRFGLHMCL